MLAVTDLPPPQHRQPKDQGYYREPRGGYGYNGEYNYAYAPHDRHYGENLCEASEHVQQLRHCRPA